MYFINAHFWFHLEQLISAQIYQYINLGAMICEKLS